MSDTSGSSGWPVMCGVLGLLLCVVTVAAVFLLMKSHAESANWKQEREAENMAFAHERKFAAKKIDEESHAKLAAQLELAKVQQQVLELQKQIAALQLAHPPAVESP